MSNKCYASPARSGVGKAIRSCVAAAHMGLAVFLIMGCGPPSGPAVLTSPEAGPKTLPPAAAGMSAVYVLRDVNDQRLPIKSPYGAGEWDYDSDAGTWQLIEASIAINVDGSYANSVIHQAKSGRTASQIFSGTYTRTSPSTLQFHASGSTTSATISEDRLIWNWGNGTIMTFER